MNLTYTKWNKELEVYYGRLKNEVELIPEVNKLEWVSINNDFFDMTKYVDEGNIGHILEEIKSVSKKIKSIYYNIRNYNGVRKISL